MKATLVALRDYQEVLHRIDELEKLLSVVPDAVKTLEQEWQVVQTRIDDLNARKTEQEAKISERQKELDEATAQAQKFEADLKMVTNGKEYNAVLKEIDAIKKRVSTCTEELSERRGDLEEVVSNLDENSTLATESRSKYESALAAHKKSQVGYEKELNQKNTQKTKLGAGITPKLMKLFNRIASRRNGVGVARCVSDVCAACNVRVRQSVVDQLRRFNSLLQCESCQRILFFDDSTDE